MKQKIVIVVVIVLLLTAVIGVSYAAFSYSQTGNYENTITTGEISMSYDETSKVINMSGALPTTDETGKVTLVEGEYFDFSVTTHIVGDTNINWEISAKALDSNTFDESNVRLYLTKIVDGEEVEVMAPTNYSESTTSNSYTGRPSGELSLLMGSTSEQGDVTTNYRLRMWVDEDYNPQGTTGGETFAIEVNVYGLQGDAMPLSAVDTLLVKANDASITSYTDGNTGEMYVFSHESGEQQVGWTTEELTDYRYIGANPNNYVTFNDELWRIVGVFTVENEAGNKEQLVKLVRNEPIGSFSWASTWGGTNWPASYLVSLLNEGLYYNRESGTCIQRQNFTIDCDFTSNGLSNLAKQMIENVKWYLGGMAALDTNVTHFSSPLDITAAESYLSERNSTVNSSNSINWIGKVGLIYPSDVLYTYENGVDRTTAWLTKNEYIWSITSAAGWSDVYSIHSGLLYLQYGAQSVSSRDVYPTVYLNSSVKITSGTGTNSDPYILQ